MLLTSGTNSTPKFVIYLFLSFGNAVINSIRPSESKIFSIHIQVGFNLLTRSRLGCSHLRENKFRHIFEETLNPLCPCSIEPETTMHFFLRCQLYNLIRVNLESDLLNIDSSLPSVCDEKLLDKLLCGNKITLMCTLKYTTDSPRFDYSIF